MNSSSFESQRPLFPCSLFIAKLAFWAGLCQLEYGIPTFDSESFELELNGIPGGISALEFRPKPFSVFGDQVSPHVHHESRTTLSVFYACIDHGSSV